MLGQHSYGNILPGVTRNTWLLEIPTRPKISIQKKKKKIVEFCPLQTDTTTLLSQPRYC